jgi:hypothetical protein
MIHLTIHSRETLQVVYENTFLNQDTVQDELEDWSEEDYEFIQEAV